MSNIEKKKAEISEQVLSRINELQEAGGLQLPKDYSPANALKGAYLHLKELKDKNGKPALEVCKQTSVAESMLKMCLEGLSVLKKQGYFIVYGTDLQWIRSYQGSVALAKRVANVLSVNAQVVYEGDVFEYAVDANTGMKKLVKHEQSIGNIDNSKIIGAYAVVLLSDTVGGNTSSLEVMTIDEIKAAWRQGATKGSSPAHTNFTQEMAKKTVINRACKSYINSSSDSYLGDINEFEDDDISNDYAEEAYAEIVNETATQPLPEISMEIEPLQDEKSANTKSNAIRFPSDEPVF